jgi:hypothetical protein
VDHACVAGAALDQAFQKRAVIVPHFDAAVPAIPLENLLHPFPGCGFDDGLLLAVVDLAPELDLAGVGRVRQQAEQQALGERLAAASLASLRDSLFGMPASAVDLPDHRKQGLVVEVEFEDGPDAVGFVPVDHETPAARIDVVAQHRVAANPLAFAPGRPHLVARSFGDDLAFELGKGQQDIQRQPAERIGGVELLRYGNEADVVLFEDLDDASEVDQRPAQPIHLIYDHAPDRSGLDVAQEALQGGAVHVAATEAAIVIMRGQQRPSLLPLAEDVGLRALPLRIQ